MQELAERSKMKPRVFVVMPFGKKPVRPEKRVQKGRKVQKSIQIDFNSVYTELIKPAVELAGASLLGQTKNLGQEIFAQTCFSNSSQRILSLRIFP